MKRIFFAIALLCVGSFCRAQILSFQNPSFEGTPGVHVAPPGWDNCMPGKTPDIQPGSWGVTLSPSEGNSYVGLVHDSLLHWQEGVGQTLSIPLIAGVSYSFNLDIATTSVVGSGIDPGCVELQVWGGWASLNSGCDKSELLWTSGDIYDAAHIEQWVTHQAVFTPTQNWDHILFVVSSLGCTYGPYVMFDKLESPSQIPLLSIIMTHSLSCYGFCDGEAQANVYAFTPPLHYLWSTGDTLQSVTGLCAGDLWVQVTDSSGVVYLDSIYVVDGPSLSTTSPQQICIATIDSSILKNLIVWAKPASYVPIDTFLIQRESSVPNNYVTIGKRAFADTSLFYDLNSNPDLKAERYVIKSIDTCGRLTSAGVPNRTIHLDISPGMGGSWDLAWNAPEGFGYNSYQLLRGNSPDNLTLFTLLPLGNTFYNDLAPPSGILYYQIIVEKPSECHIPNILTEFNFSFSNIVCNSGSGIQDNPSVPLFTVKPNPATDFITVTSQPSSIHASFIMTDVTGREVLRQMITETEMKVETGELSPGVYFGHIMKEGLPVSSVRIVVTENGK